jgi:NitT/TauT family transport system ATP-binding protein
MVRIELKNINMLFGKNGTSTAALENVSLSINDGDFVSLIGPSGCGKSTLLDTVAGLKVPTSGQVLIDGREIRGPGPDRGVVFQDYSLFPWMSALENVRFAIEHSKEKTTKDEATAKAKKYLEIVGLPKFENNYPATLSGGMRQRLAIARMFAMNPEVFLMDEPFGALDSLNRIYMQDLLTYLWSRDENRKTVLFVTHDVDEALLLSDRVVVMTPTPGRIKDVVEVHFPRPRRRKDILASQDYIILRSKLMARFCEDMQDDYASQERDTITWSI